MNKQTYRFFVRSIKKHIESCPEQRMEKKHKTKIATKLKIALSGNEKEINLNFLKEYEKKNWHVFNLTVFFFV